jgi:hypothetical protein
MATNLAVVLEDRPGEFARLTEALGNAGVNIEGLCGLARGGQGIANVLVEDAAAARAAIEAAGLRIEAEAEAVIIDVSSGADTPGTAAALARKVADAGVNVLAAYTATHDRAVMITSDNAKAREALEL